jgi:hypothetical protein
MYVDGLNFMFDGVSSPLSQQPATFPYPGEDKSLHGTPSYFFNNCFNIIFKIYLCVSSSLAVSVFHSKTLAYFSSPHTCPTSNPAL